MSKVCRNCGNILNEKMEFCPKCGTKAETVQAIIGNQMNKAGQTSKPAGSSGKKVWIISAAVSVVIVGLSVFAILAIIKPFGKKEESWQIQVPDVVGSNYKSAQDELTDKTLHGLICDKIENGDEDENSVITQNPEAEEVVSKGSIVDLVLSAGEGKNYLPDTTDYTFEYAKQLIEGAGFTIKLETGDNDNAAPGSVYEQSQKGVYTEKGQEITIKIASDKEISEETVTVPDIEGKNIDDAKAQLNKVGLYLAVNVAQYSDDAAKDTVLKQNKTAGSKAKKGETVLVTISLGKETVYVPDVTYTTEEKAVQTLEKLGLEVEIKYEESKEIAKGTVIKQETGEGTEVSKGTKVIIAVSSGYETEVPDVTGEKEEDAVGKLIDAELAVNVVYRKDDSVERGCVISQNYDGGEKVQMGTVVTIFVSAKKDSGEEVSATEEETTTKETTAKETTENQTSETTAQITTKATTAAADDQKVSKMNPSYLEAKNSDYTNLEDFLAACAFRNSYNYKSASAEDVFDIMSDREIGLPVYEYFYNKKTVNYYNDDYILDPLGKYPKDEYGNVLGYDIYNAENVNWITRNVFNVEPKTINEKTIDYDDGTKETYCYFYDNNYYSVIPFYGVDGGIEYEVKNHERNEDGSYKITLSYTVYCCGDGDFPTGTAIVNAALKENDGKRYWSIFSYKES